MINTKITIDGTTYSDYRRLLISKSMSEFNSSGDYTVQIDTPHGRHSSDFVVGKEIQIYADQDATPTTLLFTGIVERVQFIGERNNQTVEIIGRDYSARLQDVTVEPTVYTNSEVSTIVQNIMDNFVTDVTTTNVDVTTTTLERISFNHLSVFDALIQLAKLSGFVFYVDEDKDLHFERVGKTSSGLTLNNTNILNTTFNQTRERMANSVWVYGDRQLTGTIEDNRLNGSAWGGNPGSVFTLISKPHNVLVEYLGNPLKGGVYQMTVVPTSGPDYLVNFEDRQLIFQSGTDIGYSTIPVSGGSIITTYDRDVPIVKFGENRQSINSFGKRVKIINDKTIKDPTTAANILKAELENANPLKGIEIELKGWLALVPGNTVNVTLSDFNLAELDVGIITVDYLFDKFTVNSEHVMKVRLDNKILDITDQITNIRQRLDSIESQDRQSSDTITRFEDATGSFLVVGSSWEVRTASQTGSTMYLSSSARIFGGLASGTNQGILAGSPLGSPYTAFQINFSGGYFG